MIERSARIPDALDFVAEHPHVYLLARRPDGYPTGYAMLARVRDGFVDFSTYRASAKVKNLLRDGVAGILALSDGPDGQVELLAEGTVTMLEEGSWTQTTGGLVGRSGQAGPNVPPDVADKVRDRHETGKRIVLRVNLFRARFSSTFGTEQ